METTAICAQCGTTLTPQTRVETADRSFCRPCFDRLEADLRAGIEATRTDVPYPAALGGALLGGAAGALLWWGFTVLTNIAFGLVAVAIGFLVGHGTVRFAGGKRSRGLQVLSVAVALLSFLVASYLVNMTFVNHALAEQNDTRRLGFPPSNLAVFVQVIGMGFGIMDVVFVAITLWEAWKIPRPIPVPPPRIS